MTVNRASAIARASRSRLGMHSIFDENNFHAAYARVCLYVPVRAKHTMRLKDQNWHTLLNRPHVLTARVIR
jgi:hypothetical protein